MPIGDIRSIYMSRYLRVNVLVKKLEIKAEWPNLHESYRRADYASMRLVNWLVASVCGVPVSTKDDSVARNLFVQGERPVRSHRTCRRTLRRSSPGTPPPLPGGTNSAAACSMATCTPHTLASHALARAEPPALADLATALCMSAQPIGQRQLKG